MRGEVCAIAAIADQRLHLTECDDIAAFRHSPIGALVRNNNVGHDFTNQGMMATTRPRAVRQPRHDRVETIPLNRNLSLVHPPGRWCCDIVGELMLMCEEREPARPDRCANCRRSERASRPCPASRIARRFGHRTCRADAVAGSDDEHCLKFRSSSLGTEQVAQSSRWKA